MISFHTSASTSLKRIDLSETFTQLSNRTPGEKKQSPKPQKERHIALSTKIKQTQIHLHGPNKLPQLTTNSNN